MRNRNRIIIYVSICSGIVCFINIFALKLSGIQDNYSPWANGKSPSLNIPLVTILCENLEPEGNFTEHQTIMYSSDRQLEQLRTMLGSLLYFSKSKTWRVIIFINSESFYRKFLDQTTLWPPEYRDRLLLEKRTATMDTYAHLLTYYRPCSWFKVFLESALKDLDAAVYADTDVIFTSPAEELWSVYSEFDDDQLVALGPEVWYREENNRPYPGSTGVNTGVMVMNLTRMRNVPGGGFFYNVFQEKNEMTAGVRHDQDLANSFLQKNPQFLYRLSYRWNFLFSYCSKWAIPCPECIIKGVSIVHGADGFFYRKMDGKFVVLYRAISEATRDMKTTPEELLKKIQDESALLDYLNNRYSCSNHSQIPSLYLHHLKELVEQRSNRLF